jgi:hypothetical protein
MADTLGTLKTAYDLAVNLHDATVRQGKVAELQRQILDAQQSAIDANQERATLMETISELKGKVAQLEAWNIEKNRYRKTEVAEGVIAYVLGGKILDDFLIDKSARKGRRKHRSKR